MKKALVLIMLFASLTFLHAEEADFLNKIEVIPGSEALSVRTVCQDDEGMIWLGTDKNLYSYDGHIIDAHYDERGHNDHFQINTLVSIGENIVLGCVNGMVVYNKLEETFTPIALLNGIEVQDFAVDKDRREIWVATETGLFKYNVETQEVSLPHFANHLKTPQVRAVEIFDDILYIGTKGTFGQYNFKTGKYQQSNDDKNEYYEVCTITALNKDTLIVGISDRTALYENKTGKFSVIGYSAWVKSTGISRNICLSGTDAGLLSYDVHSRQLKNLTNIVAWDIISDKLGNIWFATENGLMVAYKHKMITDVGCAPANANNLYCSIRVNNGGTLFAGGSYGIIVFGGKDGNTRWFKMDDKVNPLINNKIRQIVHNRETDTIWALTASGILRYSHSSGQFEPYWVQGKIFHRAYDMIVDGHNMWIASLDGLHLIQNDQIAREYGMADGLKSVQVHQLAQDALGNIWMKTFDRKLFKLDINSDTISEHKEATNAHVDYLFADSSGLVWLSSSNKITRMDASSGKKTCYDLKGNLKRECLSMIDSGDMIWASYPNEIYVIDKNSGHIRQMYTNHTYSNLYFDKPGNRILMGALDRIDAIEIEDFLHFNSNSDAHIRITDILVNGKEYISKKQLAAGKTTLPYNCNSVSVQFTDFNYSSGNHSRCWYRIGRKNSQWHEIDASSNHFMLTNLSSRKHEIYITSSIDDEPERALFAITIKRPWYRSITAILLYVAILVLIVRYVVASLALKKQVKLERIQKANEISQAKSKINFFADVAHEFKTPLSLIIAPTTMLIQEITDRRHLHNLKLIHENAEKLNSLIQFSLDYYRNENDIDSSIIPTSIEIVDFVQRIINTYRENFSKLHFEFQSNYAKIHSKIDVVKTEVIISNLISNACKYTSDGGIIICTLEYDRDSDLLRFKISDTGIGIPKNEIPYIFQRYYQSSRTKDNGKGTGLGLAIVKRNIDILKGSIDVASDTNGSSFTFTIPLLKDDGKEAESATILSDKENKPTIAVIDDNKDICDFLRKSLSVSYNCICAYNGSTGLKLCEDIIPDLIISDIVMPEMNGLEMCRKIRNNAALNGIPIILLTAKDDQDTELDSININIDCFMSKPFDMKMLIAKIEQLVSRRKSEEDRIRLKLASEPKLVQQTSYNENLLQNITAAIEKNLDDAELNGEKLSQMCNLNEKTLYRKLKSLTGMSIQEYIRSIRMKRAAQLLQNGSFSVSEVMYIVGFNNPSYFSKVFCAQYGKTPKEYKKEYN